MSKRTRPLAFVASLHLLAGLPVAVAGPPLVIDDPGILDPGQWEFIAAVTGESTSAGEVYELPVLDVSYGLTPDVQVSVVYPYVRADASGASSDSDFGNLEIAVKWRFWNTDELQVSLGSGYQFGVSSRDAAQGFGADQDTLSLPLDLEYALGNAWRLNAELAYAVVADGGDEWGYGVAIAHPLGARTQAMLELYGAAASNFDDDFLGWTLGFDVTLTEPLHLLLSGGTGLREPAGADAVDYNFFLGLQYVY